MTVFVLEERETKGNKLDGGGWKTREAEETQSWRDERDTRDGIKFNAYLSEFSLVANTNIVFQIALEN